MKLTPRGGADRRIGAGGEQGVREQDTPVAHLHNLRALRLGQRIAFPARHGVYEVQGGVGHRGGCCERAESGWREVRKSRPHELLQRGGKPLAGLELECPGLERPGELEREKRVPARQLVDAMEGGSRRHVLEPSQQQSLHGAQAERRQLDPIQAIGGKRLREAERGLFSRRCALSEQEPDRVVPQAPGHEAQHGCRGRVEPLDVVDGDNQWRPPGQRAKNAERGHGNHLLVWAPTLLVSQQESYLECAPLRVRQLSPGVVMLADEVPEGRVREARLGLRGPGRERQRAVVRWPGQAPPARGTSCPLPPHPRPPALGPPAEPPRGNARAAEAPHPFR